MKLQTRPLFSITLSLLMAAGFALSGSQRADAQEAPTSLQQEDVVDTLFLPIAMKAGFGSGNSGAYPGPEDPTAEPTDEPAPTEEPAPTDEPEPTGECDLVAEITDPTSGQLPGGQPAFWSLRFRNAGDGLCFDNGVELLRFRGSTGAGTPELIGTLQALPELAPGQETTLSYNDDETPRTGTHRYRIRYELPQSDANNENHQPEKVVTFVWDGGSGGFPPPPPPGNPEGPCDLRAAFIAPQSTNRVGGQSFSFTVEFENIGDETCSGNNISLERFVGATATGPATRIGGSGGFEQLPDLRGGHDTRLSWTENTAPQTGTYTYKIRYSSPHNDEDNFNHYPEITINYAPQGGGNQGACDLQAQFTNPTTNTPIGGVQVNWQVRFRNLGTARCDANTVSLERFNGGSASGVATRIGGSGAFRQLSALNPGQSQTLGWTELNTPNTGTFTYRIKYSSAHNDANNNNHRPQKTVTYMPQNGGGGNPGDCDLTARFSTPTFDQLPGGETAIWQVQFRNEGNARCDANNISLERFNGNNASGAATRIGGSGGFRQLNALNPGQLQTLTWQENNAPDIGTYTYRIKYSSAHNDADNNNHRPQKTVSYVPQNGGGNQGNCDIEATFASPSGTTLQGGQNVTWEVRLRNRGNGSCAAGQLKLRRYVGENVSGPSELIGQTNYNALAPNQSQSYSWTRSSSSAGGWYTYTADLGNHSDGNNNNHKPRKTVRYRAQGCDIGVQITSPNQNSLNGGQNYTWQVRVTNLGNQQCREGSVRLVRYDGNRPTGNSTLIGLADYPRLNPDQTRNISWTRQAPTQDGNYTWQVRRDGSNDANGGNDRHDRTYNVR